MSTPPSTPTKNGNKKEKKIVDIRKAGLIGGFMTFDGIGAVERTPCKIRVKFTQGEDTIFAYVDKDTNLATRFLEFIKGKSEVTFEGNTFKAENITGEFACREATRPYILNVHFLQSPGSPTKKRDFTGLNKVSQKMSGQGPFVKQPLTDVYIKSGTVYRYRGCTNCRKKLHAGNSSCRGEPGETQIVLRDVEIVDSAELNFAIDGVVIFNDQTVYLLNGKKGDDFDSDNEAQKHFNVNCIGIRLTLMMHRKKATNPRFRPSPYADKIIKREGRIFFLGQLDSTSSGVEENGNHALTTNDGGGNVGPIPETFPDLPEYPIELNPHTMAGEELNRLYHAYTITSKPRGLVLLINNDFEDSSTHGPRFGSDKDVTRIETGFRKMGYELFKNKCWDRIEDIKVLDELIYNFKAELVKYNMSSAFVIVMSHGTSHEIQLEGGNPLTNMANVTQNILLPFSDVSFPEFIGKPKVFVVTTCQTFSGFSNLTSGLRFRQDALSDTLVCFAVPHGYENVREWTTGTVFVYYLIKMMMAHAASAELREILEMTQREIREAVTTAGATHIAPNIWWTNLFNRFYLLKDANNDSM